MLCSVTDAPFKAQDWGAVKPAVGLSVFQPSPEALVYVEEHQLARTMRNAAGDIVAYLGMRALGAKRVEVWAIVDFGRTMREFADISRVAKEYLNSWEVDRVEAFVECDFRAGHIWVNHLGFTLEAARMRKYLPDGKDCALYARVRGEDGQWDSPR